MLTYEACFGQISRMIASISERFLARCIEVTPTENQEMRNFKKLKLGWLCFVGIHKTLRAIHFTYIFTGPKQD